MTTSDLLTEARRIVANDPPCLVSPAALRGVIAELVEALVASQRDALRYRYVKDKAEVIFYDPHKWRFPNGKHFYSRQPPSEELDGAIDAALAQEQKLARP